jgi:hypothetical protein
MDINLGPCFLRWYSGQNWSLVELGVVSRRHGGLARRESALKIGLKSEHALELFSVENTADRFVAPDGSITYGRICIQSHRRYSLSAEQVYSGRLFDQALQSLRQTCTAIDPQPLPGCFPAAGRQADPAGQA